MGLILHDLQPMHWALAGALIAAVTVTMLFLANRRLGISSGFEDLCGMVLHAPYFRQPEVIAQRSWRLPFLGGLVAGGVLSAVLAGGWQPFWDLGMFDERIGWGPAGKVAWMFVGGLLIGFGTRMAGGCTSGHGIFGLSNFEVPSLVATVSFVGAGILTTNLLYRVVVG